MNIEVETKDAEGNITFKGKLTNTEIDLILNVGINFLLANGAMPLMVQESTEASSVLPEQTTVQ